MAIPFILFALNYLEDQQYFNVYGTDITELKKMRKDKVTIACGKL